MKSLKEQAAEKFQRATKTDVHYTGTINGKTYVVPHSFHGSHDVLHGTKVTPIRHAIVVSPTHVQHNNPTLKPEEVARVHQHIKDIHGGQQAQTPKFDSFGKLEEETHSGLTPPSHAFKNAPENKPMYDLMRKAKREKVKAERPMRKGAADRFLRRFGESEEKPVKGTPEYQAERDKYRHAALAASRKAATLAFAKKHHIINEGPLKKPNYGDPFAHHQTVIAKKTLRMPDAMVGVMGGPNKDESRKHLKKIGWTDEQIHKHEHGQFAVHEGTMIQEHSWIVTDHRGVRHEVAAKDPSEAKKKVVSVGGIYPEGIPMTQWHKVGVQRKNLEEKTLTPAETEKKEELVHKMKPKLQGFKDRYGADKGKSVLYAVATKQAKKLAEESEQLNELSDAAKQFIHHREHYWKLAKGHSKANPYGPTKTQRQQMNVHSKEMEKHHKAMTPAERHVAHTGSYVSSASKRLQGGSAKEDKQYVHESFMGTYTRNENANRHTANIVHLAKHFGTPADQAEAKFYHDELKKHGHNKHHEAAYKLHEKLWPFAVAAHHMSEGVLSKIGSAVSKALAAPSEKMTREAEKERKKLHKSQFVKGTAGPKWLPKAIREGEETMSTKKVVKEVLAEMMTRKHFQQVADLIKANPDAAKRQELANHHATVFAAQNPRFDHARFHAAAGTKYKE